MFELFFGFTTKYFCPSFFFQNRLKFLWMFRLFFEVITKFFCLSFLSPKQVNVSKELKAEKFPHFMGREPSYHSTSILGQIYDAVESFQPENQSTKGEDSLSNWLCNNDIHRDEGLINYLYRALLSSSFDTMFSFLVLFKWPLPCYTEIWRLPLFNIDAVPQACLRSWKDRYDQYRSEMAAALQHGGETKDEYAAEVINKYKQVIHQPTLY